MTDTPERDVVERLIEQLNICADDPMWADHCEMRKETARRAADTITSLRAQLRDARDDCAKVCDGYAEAARMQAAEYTRLENAHSRREELLKMHVATILAKAIRARAQQQIGAETKPDPQCNRCGALLSQHGPQNDYISICKEFKP